jgi:hypothetical protein
LAILEPTQLSIAPMTKPATLQSGRVIVIEMQRLVNVAADFARPTLRFVSRIQHSLTLAILNQTNRASFVGMFCAPLSHMCALLRSDRFQISSPVVHTAFFVSHCTHILKNSTELRFSLEVKQVHNSK